MAWHAALPDATDEDITEAVRRQMVTSTFWPGPADIARQIEGIRAEAYRERQRRTLALPQDTITEEMRTKNAANARKLIIILSKSKKTS